MFDKYFIEDSLHNTRQRDTLNKIKFLTTLRAKCVFIAGVKLWNGLRIALRNCTNIFTLKKCTKHLYLIDIKWIFYSETCINIFIVLAFGIFMH